ncbi:MAG: flippase-like domain-containing protein [Alphaproteobacteria bacterium]|nr:flippase-like domain-containing protein [Alphaproteobacteria bacterium]
MTIGADRKRFGRLPLLIGLAGLALGTALIGWFGFDRVVEGAISVGPWGFAAICAWQLVLFVVLGLCWYVLLPRDRTWRIRVLVAGRMVRDAAGTCLPFSRVGGFVFGARAVILQGVPWPAAAASTVVDLTAEFLAQIGLVLIGVLILSARSPGSSLTLPLSIGLVVALIAGLAFAWLQRGGGMTSPLMRLSSRILGRWVHDATAQMAAIQNVLTAIYDAPGRVALCVALHLLAWFGTGFASWIAFRLLGADIDFLAALGIEGLLHGVLALAIVVPGHAGVQEAAYAGIGALFGQPPELSLGISLLRRARDVALGVPILLIWQAAELRRRRA